MKGFGSHALMKDGLLFRLELLLPGIALPVRVHECRNFAGAPGSFANSLVGIIARLQRNLGDNLEPRFPAAVPFVVRAMRLAVNDKYNAFVVAVSISLAHLKGSRREGLGTSGISGESTQPDSGWHCSELERRSTDRRHPVEAVKDGAIVRKRGHLNGRLLGVRRDQLIMSDGGSTL